MKNYKVVNGLSFAEGTNDQVCSLISNLSRSTRIRVWYGDTITGRSWNEENDITGYVGRSTGTVKVPLLINNTRSYGGPEMFSDSIIKMVDTRTKRVMYQHPTFNQPVFTNNGAEILENGEHFGRNSTPASAARFCDFMNGKRMSK